MKAVILQIENNPKHPFYTHTLETKKFIGLQTKQNTNIRAISFMETPKSALLYNKSTMEHFMYRLWSRQIKSQLQTEYKTVNISNDTVAPKLLFPRGSSRIYNSQIMDYLHGHSLTFKNFAFSVKRSDTPTCMHCKTMRDSPQHQLFECCTFQCDQRTKLLNYWNGNCEQYELKILFETKEDIVNLFMELVKEICLKNSIAWPDAH